MGHDKEGSRVWVEPFGRLDMRGLMASCKKSDLERTKLMLCETTVRDWREQSEKVRIGVRLGLRMHRERSGGSRVKK